MSAAKQQRTCPSLTQQQSTDNKVGLMLVLRRGIINKLWWGSHNKWSYDALGSNTIDFLSFFELQVSNNLWNLDLFTKERQRIWNDRSYLWWTRDRLGSYCSQIFYNQKTKREREINFKQKISYFIFERKQTFVNTQLILQIRLLLEESLKSESFWWS